MEIAPLSSYRVAIEIEDGISPLSRRTSGAR